MKKQLLEEIIRFRKIAGLSLLNEGGGEKELVNKILSRFMEKETIGAGEQSAVKELPREYGAYTFASEGKTIRGYMTIGQYETLMTKEVLTSAEQQALHQVNKNIIEKSANAVGVFRNSIRDVLKTYTNSAEKAAFLNKTYEKLFDEQTLKVFKEKSIALKAAEKKVTGSEKPKPEPKPEPKFELPDLPQFEALWKMDTNQTRAALKKRYPNMSSRDRQILLDELESLKLMDQQTFDQAFLKVIEKNDPQYQKLLQQPGTLEKMKSRWLKFPKWLKVLIILMASPELYAAFKKLTGMTLTDAFSFMKGQIGELLQIGKDVWNGVEKLEQTPTPAPSSGTMTMANVEQVATDPTGKYGLTKPLTFNPKTDNVSEYTITDGDGDTFKATLDKNGKIVIQ